MPLDVIKHLVRRQRCSFTRWYLGLGHSRWHTMTSRERFNFCLCGLAIHCARRAFTYDARIVTTWINTGAFLANFILRFAPGWCDGKFQPYLGAGVGGYYAESAGVEVQDPVTGRVPINTGGGANHADLAFDALAGADYFFNPQWSAFVEYKYLNYQSTQINTRENRALGQQLVGAGPILFPLTLANFSK